MCPTELQWQKGHQPELRLLPIRSRARQTPVNELKRYPEEWTVIALDAVDAPGLQAALARGRDRAGRGRRSAGARLPVDAAGDDGIRPDAEGRIEIPRWRHAVIQFPHPLLEQGLVVLDTPGLNAIGAEPELTLSMLPNAHAVLFILAADTGVTQSDLAVWRNYVQAGSERQRGRLVVLNKIDGLWDGLRDEARIEAEIGRQVDSVAATLGVEPPRCSRCRRRRAWWRASRATRPCSRAAVCHSSSVRSPRTCCPPNGDRARGHPRRVRRGRRRHAQPARGAPGRFARTAPGTYRPARQEPERHRIHDAQDPQRRRSSSRVCRSTTPVRTVFLDLANNLFAHMGLDAVRDETRRTREAMLESSFTRGLRNAMQGYFRSLRGNLQRSTEEIGEITRMLDAMYKRFSVEHGLKLTAPEGFSTLRYEKEPSAWRRPSTARSTPR